jgi:hypothetical protein
VPIAASRIDTEAEESRRVEHNDAIRRDIDAGESIRAISVKRQVRLRDVRAALKSPTPLPRKGARASRRR